MRFMIDRFYENEPMTELAKILFASAIGTYSFAEVS